MNNKGMSAEMFKWIFIVVVGGLILTFFVRFTFQQTEIFGQKGSVQLVASLEDQLEAFGVSETSFKSISLGYNTEVQFSCDKIINLEFPKSTNLLIFAPNLIKGDNLLSWSKTWEFPYAVANFYYLTGEKSRFLLIYDENSLEKIAQLNIPKLFNLQKINFDNLNLDDLAQNSKSLDQLNLVYFTPVRRPTEIFKKFPMNLNLNVVEIDLEENQIKIYQPDSTFTSTYFLEDQMMYGAIFGPENYDCIKSRAIERLNLVTDIHSQKAVYLASKTKSELCRAKYYEIRGSLDSINTASSKQAFNDLAEKIDSQNKGLRKNACPTIY